MTRLAPPPTSGARRAGVLALLAACLLAAGGCAQRPVAVSSFVGTQQVLESAEHWRLVANDVGSAISAYLRQSQGDFAPVNVYMMRGGDSLFADAFLSAVTTQLVARGHAVALDSRPDVLSVGIDMLVVPSNPRTRTVPAPGVFTALGAGAAVGKVLLDNFPWGITATAAGLALDAAAARPTETDTELILTVSLEQSGFYVFRSTAVYYVNSRDLWHYQGGAELAQGRTLNDLPAGTIAYDLARRPYVVRR